MTTIEVGRIEEVEVEEIDEDDLPLGHLPDDQSWKAMVERNERPTRALCGAELLGIPTGDLPFRECEECARIAFERGIEFHG